VEKHKIELLFSSLSLCVHIYYWRVDRERTQEYLFFNMEAEEDKIDTLT
jgi:hypothetical protein